jgi:hypothetical protein
MIPGIDAGVDAGVTFPTFRLDGGPIPHPQAADLGP